MYSSNECFSWASRSVSAWHTDQIQPIITCYCTTHELTIVFLTIEKNKKIIFHDIGKSYKIHISTIIKMFWWNILIHVHILYGYFYTLQQSPCVFVTETICPENVCPLPKKKFFNHYSIYLKKISAIHIVEYKKVILFSLFSLKIIALCGRT